MTTESSFVGEMSEVCVVMVVLPNCHLSKLIIKKQWTLVLLLYLTFCLLVSSNSLISLTLVGSFVFCSVDAKQAASEGRGEGEKTELVYCERKKKMPTS